jgi:hypothetical protein
MDDKEKSAIEKMIDKVNDAVENIANTVSAAAMKAMEPEPDAKQVAGTTNEQVYIPEATDAAAGPAPLFAASAKKKRALPKTTAVKAPHLKNRRRNLRERKQLRPPQKHRRRLRKSPERINKIISRT